MTDLTTSEYKEKVYLSLKKRNRAEARYKAYGIAAITFGLMCVFLLFFDSCSMKLTTKRACISFYYSYLIANNKTYARDKFGQILKKERLL